MAKLVKYKLQKYKQYFPDHKTHRIIIHTKILEGKFKKKIVMHFWDHKTQENFTQYLLRKKGGLIVRKIRYIS